MDLCLSETQAGEYHQDYRHVFVFEELRSCTLKRKAVVFKFLWFEVRFRKAPFL